jgi:MFS family permease
MVGTVLLAVGAVGFTTTAITVGTRGMAVEFGLSTRQLGWVVNAYLVAAGALVLVGARLGDTYGRVRTFTAGLALFASASVVGLVASRVGQGVGAALILPASLEVIAAFSTEGDEDHDFRWRGLVYASSFAVGPLLGGVLTDWLSWRWIFIVDAVVVLMAMLIVYPLRARVGRGTRRPTTDYAGAVMVAVMLGVVVLLAEQFSSWPDTPAAFVVMAAIVVVLVPMIIRHERSTDHPLLHASILEDRPVLGANVATLGASLGMLSLLYFFNLFAQSAATFDSSAVAVVAALAPFIGSLLLCASFAHWLGRRLGRRWPPMLGLTLMTIGFALLATTSAATTKSELAVPLVLSGVGAGIANASLTSVALLDLPAGRINEAAGWISLSRFLGSAMALAIGTSAFLSVAASAPAVPPPDSEASSVESEGRAFDMAVATLDRDLSSPTTAAADSTSAKRFSRTMGVTAGVLAGITVLSWWLIGPRTRDRTRRGRRRRTAGPQISFGTS